ncbi:MAG: transglycosylase SLT domain-containing protein [Luteitalea sp.]|nr:transglycosylase SLT domain-containing protein [Luteitalea sp.]
MRSLVLSSALVLVAAVPRPLAQQPTLAPTSHPPLPRELGHFWLAPERTATAARASSPSPFATAVHLQSTGDYAASLAIVSQPALQQGPLADYADYYAAVAHLRVGRSADARRLFQAIQSRSPVGYLGEAAAFGEAESAEAMSDPASAVEIYERLLEGKPSAHEDTLLRLGRAAKAAGEQTKAFEAFARVYYEFALSAAAPAAGTELALLTNRPPMEAGSQRFKLELGRAERMFGARQYAAARSAFDAIRSAATGDDRQLVQLRLAECDYFLKRPRAARTGLRPFLERSSRQGEALFFHALASRTLGDDAEYLRTVRRIVAEFPMQTWAEEALDNLATYYILRNRDDEADRTFRELYERYPRGSNAPRAAWKAGWRAYREARFSDTVRYFEGAAADFPRSDYRPAWLYWSARSLERSGDAAAAAERYALVTADYRNSYYGRLTARRTTGPKAVLRAVAAPGEGTPDSEEREPTAPPLPANAHVVRALLDAGMFDDALNELRYAQKVWGDAPAIQATVAWVQQQQSRTEIGMRRFQLLRGAINTMRRAYPQYMAAGGERLPREVLTVIFPMAYWDLIRKHAAARDLDPYLVAALVAQESTFVADVRSHANAYGLMQLLPSTARQYARKLKMRYSTRLLTDPESNIRIGTSYLADKIREFGDLHLALASYNAGETPVRRWRKERPDLEGDEFVDDIPYPETQGYVKKILGTAEDYRRLYGGREPVNGLESDVKPRAIVKKPAPAASKPTRAAPTTKKAPVRKRR